MAIGRIYVDQHELESLWAYFWDDSDPKIDKLPDYIPPYLAFMLKAAAALQLSADERRLKKEIEPWLQEHWPPEFGDVSKAKEKISYMATFLRQPEDQKGGYFSSARTRNGAATSEKKGRTLFSEKVRTLRPFRPLAHLSMLLLAYSHQALTKENPWSTTAQPLATSAALRPVAT